MSMTPFPNGITSFGMPVIGGKFMTTGEVYFVHHTGSNGNVGTDADHPFATLSYAYDQCSANAHDFIFVMPGHAETITATIALDTAGVAIVGLGHGSNRPKITQTTTGSDNGFEISAAGQYIENIWFYDSCSGGTVPEVYFDIQAGGDTATFVNCRFEQRAIVTEAVTMVAGADDVTFKDCEFIGTSAGPDKAIVVEGACDRLLVDGCRFIYNEAAGIDDACITFEVSDSYNPIIKDCVVAGLADGDYFVQCSVGQSAYGGIIAHCFGSVTDLTDVFAVTNGFVVIDSYFSEAGKFAGAGICNLTSGDITIIPSGTAIV